MKNHPHILLVSGSSVRRRSLSNLLRKNLRAEDLTVVSGLRLSKASLEQNPAEVLIADLESPEAAAELIRVLEDFSGAPGTVALVDNPAPAWLQAAIHAGVNAFISRNPNQEELHLAITAAEAGLILLHPSSALSLATRSLPSPDLLHDVERLTAREGQVLRLISEGLGNKEIAARLDISEHTAKFHASSILGKLGVGSRAEAVTEGIRRGLIAI
jgi:DNA-binding NarL/FixJ family response regulator